MENVTRERIASVLITHSQLFRPILLIYRAKSLHDARWTDVGS